MRRSWLVTALLLAFACGSCSGIKPTTFLHPEYNFSFAERVAIVPFENLTKDQGAGTRATRFFLSELLATEAFEVVEPGEVASALEKMGLVRTADLTQAQAISLGKTLGVQAIFLGSIGESSSAQRGSSSAHIVTLIARLMETETGVTVWSTTHTESGRGFWSMLFGTGEKSMSEVTRQCVERSIRTLVN